MAQYQKKFKGDYNKFTEYIEYEVQQRSFTSSFEGKMISSMADVKCTVLVFERYSYLGKNRVSLNVTILGHGDEIEVMAITAGGSQAVLFKVNTWGEENYLSYFEFVVNQYLQKNP